MKYSYDFFRGHVGTLRIKLADEIKLFADFIEDISSEQKADEYITIYMKSLSPNATP